MTHLSRLQRRAKGGPLWPELVIPVTKNLDELHFARPDCRESAFARRIGPAQLSDRQREDDGRRIVGNLRDEVSIRGRTDVDESAVELPRKSAKKDRGG